MDIAAWGLFVSSFILGWFYYREYRKSTNLRLRLVDTMFIVSNRDQTVDELQRQLTLARESHRREWDAHTKASHELDTANGTIANLKVELARLQAAARVRSANQ